MARRGYKGEFQCEWCSSPATRCSHDGCHFCDRHAMSGDMYLPERPIEKPSDEVEEDGGE